MEFPDLPTTDWSDKLPLLWYYMKWWIKEHQVWVMIVASFPIAAALIGIVTNLFTRDDDEEDEYEVRHY